MTAALSPKEVAEAVGRGMYARDHAAHLLGIALDEIGPGYARMRMTVRPDMLNGHAIGHGGFIFTLADTAFAYSCNSYNHNAVAQFAQINFLAAVPEGAVLTAEAREQTASGRTGIYDVAVTDETGKVVAMFRGASARIKGHVVPELADG